MSMDVTDLIERFERFEERAGIRLEGLYAEKDEFITINGEIYPREGTEIKQDMELIISALDPSGRVLRTSSYYVDASSFYGFETFHVYLSNSPIAVSKIRIYPKAHQQSHDEVPF